MEELPRRLYSAMHLIIPVVRQIAADYGFECDEPGADDALSKTFNVVSLVLPDDRVIDVVVEKDYINITSYTDQDIAYTLPELKMAIISVIDAMRSRASVK